MSVHDRWHLSRKPKDPSAKRCGKHRLYQSAEHGQGLRWQVTGVDQAGNPLPKKNFEFEEDAKLHDAAITVQVASDTFIDEKAGKVTLQVYSEAFRKTRTHGDSTAERLESLVRIHVYSAENTPGITPSGSKSIGDYPMNVLSRHVRHVREWVAGIRLHPNTARLLIDRLAAVFDAAVEDKIIASNPLKARSVDLPDRLPTEVIAWTAEQIEATAEALPVRLQAMAFLGGVTGMRQGELFGVSAADLDFLRRSVHVEVQVAHIGGQYVFKPLKTAKRGASKRDVPVAASVLPVITEHMRKFPPVEVTLPWYEKEKPKKHGQPVTRMLVFTSEAGTQWNRPMVNRAWRPAWAKAGIADLGRANGMHVLRHSAASRWLSKGLNISKVASYLGDSVAVTVSTYSHFLPEDEELGRAIMDDFLTPSLARYFPDNSLASGA